jgi:hypothetical protein
MIQYYTIPALKTDVITVGTELNIIRVTTWTKKHILSSYTDLSSSSNYASAWCEIQYCHWCLLNRIIYCIVDPSKTYFHAKHKLNIPRFLSTFIEDTTLKTHYWLDWQANWWDDIFGCILMLLWQGTIGPGWPNALGSWIT